MGLINREDHSSTQLIIPQNAIQEILLEKISNEYPDLRNRKKPTIKFINEEEKEVKPSFMCELYYDEGVVPKRNGEK